MLGCVRTFPRIVCSPSVHTGQLTTIVGYTVVQVECGVDILARPVLALCMESFALDILIPARWYIAAICTLQSSCEGDESDKTGSEELHFKGWSRRMLSSELIFATLYI